MQDLSQYNAAAFLTGNMKVGPQYVRVTRGPRAGTIGMVTEIRAKYFSEHHYQIACKGRKRFWVKGQDLAHVADHHGETNYIHDADYKVTHTDMMGKELQTGQVIMFHRSMEGCGQVELVLGTIKKIQNNGTIYAKLFKAARSEELPNSLVKVGVPASTMVMDKGVMNDVLIAKMQAF
jgi:hypothetical protein